MLLYTEPCWIIYKIQKRHRGKSSTLWQALVFEAGGTPTRCNSTNFQIKIWSKINQIKEKYYYDNRNQYLLTCKSIIKFRGGRYIQLRWVIKLSIDLLHLSIRIVMSYSLWLASNSTNIYFHMTSIQYRETELANIYDFRIIIEISLCVYSNSFWWITNAIHTVIDYSLFKSTPRQRDHSRLSINLFLSGSQNFKNLLAHDLGFINFFTNRLKEFTSLICK